MADTVSDDLHLDELFDKSTAPAEPAPEKDEASSQPRDESGRFAPKAQEKQPEPEAKAAPPPKDQEPDEETRHVPLKELRTERQKRQEEARLRAEAEGRAAAYERQLQALMQQQRQPAAPQEQQVQPPDPLMDPHGFAQYQQAMFQQQLFNERANFSEMRARDKFGDQAVDAAMEAIKAAPQEIKARLYRANDPYGELIRWHKQNSFLSKVGNDPDAYEKQLVEQTRAALLADLKAGKIKLDGQPVPQQRFPGTLADQTSASVAQTAHLSDDAMMQSVFARR